MVTRNSDKGVNEITKSDLIVASYVYDAWGNILYQEGSYADKNPYRYAGYLGIYMNLLGKFEMCS